MTNTQARLVPVMLTGGRVTTGFRDALFSAAGRAGVSVNEFVLRATGAALLNSGEDIDGVFSPGDVHNHGTFERI